MLLPFWGNVEMLTKTGGDGATSVVTDLDRSVERHLEKGLRTIDPDALFAGEEFGGSRDSERFWLCDPIDGTMHFIRGIPSCSVMLALIEGGVVSMSVIYDFVNDVMYHAVRGSGAFRGHEPIHVSDRPFTKAYIALETRLDKPENLARRQRLRSSAKLFAPAVSGYEFMLVATGKLEARIAVDGFGKDYDFAPGSLLVSEAGGVVANIGSSSYDFRNTDLIAANPATYRALTEGPEALFPIVP